MLRFIDSFEHYSTTESVADLKWSSHTNTPVISAVGRFGNGIDLTGFDSRSIRKTLDAQATWILGVAFKPVTIGSGAGHVFELLDAGTRQLDVRFITGNFLQVTRNGTVLGTGTTSLGLGIWYYLEFKATIHNSTGVAVVRIDGVNEINLSSQDTQNTANATANQVQIGRHDGGFTVSAHMDDFYACDGTGSAPTNDFLGDVRVEALFPNGNGNSSQLVGQDANSTDNYLNVDETLPDGDTTYNESSTVGNKDTYAYTNLTPTTGTVFGVQPLLYARKTDAGARSIASIARHSGTEVDSANRVLSTSYQYLHDMRETKPGGGSWSISDVNGAEFGVKVTV